MKNRQTCKRPKRPEPFFRKFTGTYYLQLGKRQINLGPDEKSAWDEYHRIMASRESLSSPSLPVWKFFEAYLDWVSLNKAPATYRSAVHYLSSFVAFLGKRKQLRHVTVDDVDDWLKKMRDPNRKTEKPSEKPWGSTTQSDAVSYVRRAFVWGERKKLVNGSPVAGWENAPSRQRREVTYSPADWERIVSHAGDDQFRDLLTFMWETGCRPIEARRLEARHLDLTNDLAVYPPSESKTGNVRVIFLTDEARAICERLCRAEPEGPIFRNSRGKPWTKDAIKCRFNRMKPKVGIEGLCAYAIRHSFATECLKKGMNSISLAVVMGHSDVSMIARTYQHLAEDVAYLLQLVKQFKSSGA